MGPAPAEISQIRRAKVLVMWSWEVSFGQSESQVRRLCERNKASSGLCTGLGITNQAGRGQSKYRGESRFLTRAGRRQKEEFWQGNEKCNSGKDVGVAGHEVRGVGWLPI